MRKLFTIIATILLIGCAKQPVASELATSSTLHQIETAEISINNLEANLPIECKTPIIMTEINAQKRNLAGIVTMAQSIESDCRAEKTALTATLAKWKIIAYVFGLLSIGLLGKLIFGRR